MYVWAACKCRLTARLCSPAAPATKTARVMPASLTTHCFELLGTSRRPLRTWGQQGRLRGRQARQQRGRRRPAWVVRRGAAALQTRQRRAWQADQRACDLAYRFRGSLAGMVGWQRAAAVGRQRPRQHHLPGWPAPRSGCRTIAGWSCGDEGAPQQRARRRGRAERGGPYLGEAGVGQKHRHQCGS